LADSAAELNLRKRWTTDVLIKRIGFHPAGPVAWLFAARGLYKLEEWHLCVEALTNCLRSQKTLKEAQHLLGFCLMYTGQKSAAASAFLKSVKMGNETDMQPLIELHLVSSTTCRDFQVRLNTTMLNRILTMSANHPGSYICRRTLAWPIDFCSSHIRGQEWRVDWRARE